MNQAVDSNHETLDQFRSYLYLLARAHLGPRVQNKIYCWRTLNPETI